MMKSSIPCCLRLRFGGFFVIPGLVDSMACGQIGGQVGGGGSFSLNHQGRIVVGGVNFNGAGQFIEARDIE